MRKKYLGMVLGVVMTGMLLGGCGSSSNSKDSSSSTEASSESSSSSSDSSSKDNKDDKMQIDENAVLGKVTKVSGNKITYEVMERDESAKPSGSAMPAGSAKPDGEPPAKPEGSAMPQGSAKPDDAGKGNGGGGMMGGFTSTGETKTITVEDGITIKSVSRGETTDATVSDIAVGTLLQIQYDDDGETLKEVDIQNMGNRGQNDDTTN